MSQQINLFNPVFLKQKKIFASVPMLQALGVLLVGMLALAFYGQFSMAAMEKDALTSASQLELKKARQAQVTAQFTPRQANKDLDVQIAAAAVELKSLQDVFGILQGGSFGNTRGYSDYFKAFARDNVSGLWLTGLSISGAGGNIGVQGRAMQAPLVPVFIEKLNREAVMRGKTFDSLAIHQAVLKSDPLKPAAPQAEEQLAPYVEFSLQSSASDKPGTAAGEAKP